jgi:hypothetical protein
MCLAHHFKGLLIKSWLKRQKAIKRKKNYVKELHYTVFAEHE